MPRIWTFTLNTPTTLLNFKLIIPHQNKCWALITPIIKKWKWNQIYQGFQVNLWNVFSVVLTVSGYIVQGISMVEPLGKNLLDTSF